MAASCGIQVSHNLFRPPPRLLITGGLERLRLGRANHTLGLSAELLQTPDILAAKAIDVGQYATQCFRLEMPMGLECEPGRQPGEKPCWGVLEV
jgi:hypothetical protein